MHIILSAFSINLLVFPVAVESALRNAESVSPIHFRSACFINLQHPVADGDDNDELYSFGMETYRLPIICIGPNWQDSKSFTLLF